MSPSSPPSTTPDLGKLLAQLRLDEGWRDRIYMDTTGNITIGYGFNLGHVECVAGHVKLSPVGRIPVVIGEHLLLGEVMECIGSLREALPFFDSLSEVRQRVLANMAYNMGMPTLLTFGPTLDLIAQGDYAAAAEHMKASLWARQTGLRAVRLAMMMKTGEDVPLT